MIPSLARAALLAPCIALPALGLTAQSPERIVLDDNTLPASLSEETLDEVKELSSNRWTRVYTQNTDDAFWARGKTYKASFAPGATTYFPLLGPDKPRLFGFSLQSPLLTVGGEEVALDGEATPHGSDTEVRYERGPMTEKYQLTTESIEQLFTFDAPLGPGALTVTIPVETELEPEFVDGGFLFRNEHGGVRYGAATVLDATGKALGVPTHWINGTLQIEVPEAFLEGAQWPVTIDPLIVTFPVDGFMDDLTRPDISYDLTTDRILVVYQESAAGADHDIYWMMINRVDLTTFDEDYWDVTTNDWYSPRVANNNFSDSFLVVAELLVNTFFHVSYRIVEADTGDQSPLWGVSAMEFVSNESPDVGGEVVLSSDSYWLVTWIERDTNGNRDVMCTRVDSTGSCLFDDVRLYGGPLRAYDPAVANTAGPLGRFNVAYAAGQGTNRQIRGAAVSWNGSVVQPDHTIANLPGELSRPAISADLASAGGRSMVVYEQVHSSSEVDLMATICDGATPQFSQNLTDQGGISLSAFRSSPRVDHDGERFGVTWIEDNGAGGTKVLASTYALAGANLCESESRVDFSCGGFPGEHGTVSIASLYSSGGPSASTFATWACQQTSYNIYAGQYRLDPTDCIGRAYCNPAVPNSSGNLGRIRVRGSHLASGGAVIMTADQLPMNQFGFFICATAPSSSIPATSNGRLCLGGTLGRFIGPGQVQSSGPTGTISLGVNTSIMPTTPTQAVMPGQTWFFQAWHRDTVGLGSNFSRATAVQFD